VVRAGVQEQPTSDLPPALHFLPVQQDAGLAGPVERLFMRYTSYGTAASAFDVDLLRETLYSPLQV